MARKKAPVTAESLVAQIREDRKRWDEIKAHGTTDPFYEDGVNLNLVRRQIMIKQDELKAFCKEQKLKACPIEATKKPPPQLSDTYMAKGSKAAKHSFHKAIMEANRHGKKSK